MERNFDYNNPNTKKDVLSNVCTMIQNTLLKDHVPSYKDQIRAERLAESKTSSLNSNPITSTCIDGVSELTTSLNSTNKTNNGVHVPIKNEFVDNDLQYKEQLRLQNVVMSEQQSNEVLETAFKDQTRTQISVKTNYKPSVGSIDPDLHFKDQMRQQKLSETSYDDHNQDTMCNSMTNDVTDRMIQRSNIEKHCGIPSVLDADVQYKNQIKGEVPEQYCQPIHSKKHDTTDKYHAPDLDLHYKDQMQIRQSNEHLSNDNLGRSSGVKIMDDCHIIQSGTRQTIEVDSNDRGNNAVSYKDQIQPHPLPNRSDRAEEEDDFSESIPERRPSPLASQRTVRPGAFRRYMNGNFRSSIRQQSSGYTETTITTNGDGDISESNKFADDNFNNLAVAVPVGDTSSDDGKPRTEAIEFDPDAKLAIRKYKIYRVWIFILFSVVVVVSIVLGIVLSSRNRQNVRPNPRLELGIAEFVNSQIRQFNFTSNNNTDAHMKALDWIIFDDPLELIPSKHTNFMRRYSLAYLYYALSEKDWVYCSPDPNLRCRKGSHGSYNYFSFRWLSDVDECSWSGIICDANKIHVQRIFLDEIGLHGEITANLDIIPFLDFFSMYNAGKVSGNLNHLNNAKCKNLRTIDFSSNRLTGSLPSFVMQWRSLSTLLISRNKLTGVVNLQAFNKDIKSLDISNNRFSKSTITETDILRIRSINDFTLRNNKFKGKLPHFLFTLPYIMKIDVGGNQFTGTIPHINSTSSFFLSELRLSQNQLNGTIPETIYDAKSLLSLALNNNDLHGTISTKIGQLTTLITLRFDNNDKLSGIIPTEIGLLKDLETMSISGTNTTGTIPTDLCRYRAGGLKTLTADCLIIDDVPSKVDCSCCSSCCTDNGATCSSP